MLLMPRDFCYSHRPREGLQLFQDGVETGDLESYGPWYPVPADPERGPQLLLDGVRTRDPEGFQSQLTLAGPSITGCQENGCPIRLTGELFSSWWIGRPGEPE